ncbi:serine/threonine-protein kinase [Streptomyces sp. NPDC005761]|uniref:serine/threonine-protein kinase n=1 Tax=unclassified Streptomyces TaxID=2593676 RepID=UPI0033E0C23C
MRPQDVIDQRYELVELLGQGGFGQVWRAFDSRVKRQVAVKTGSPQSDDEARRFALEAELAGNLSHPNIAALYDYGEALHEGRLMVYLVMELVPGETLGGILRRGVPPLVSSLIWAQGICEALDAAHANGVVHRDIKPANVIITGAEAGAGAGAGHGVGTAKVLDFGIARDLAHTGLTAEGYVIGSWQYMAPERWAGNVPVDGRADLYSLGCVLMELLTGQLPFTGANMNELIAQHAAGTPPRPGSLRPGLPDAVDRLVLRLLAKDPAQRPPHARQVADHLADIVRQARRTTSADPQSTSDDDAGEPFAYVPTAQPTAADPAGRAREALSSRLDRILDDYAGVEAGEFARRLDLLIRDLTAQLGAEDPLTVEAAYQRAMHAWQTAHDQDRLESVLPRLMRVLGPENRRTLDVRAVLTGDAAARGQGDGRRHLAELDDIIARATHVLGAHDPITLVARLDRADALDREYDGTGRPVHITGSRDDEQAARRRALLEPLLPDLLQGLGDDDPRTVHATLRLALDTYQLGDFRAALPLYERLMPRTSAALARSDVRLRIRHAHCVAESGSPERAVSMLDVLLTTLRNRPGHDFQQQAPPALALRGALRKQLRQERKGSGRSWFRR